jgi:hypothetical protein
MADVDLLIDKVSDVFMLCKRFAQRTFAIFMIGGADFKRIVQMLQLQ